MSVVTAVEYRAKAAAAMSEAQLLDAVRALATALSWRIYHTHDSRRSPAGFPDLVMVRDGRLLFVELKSQRGRFGPGQEAWLEELRETSALGADTFATGVSNVTVRVWRPCDLLDGTIETTLRTPG